jgi:hypothetical protein
MKQDSEEAAAMLDRNRAYASAIWHERDLLTRPPRENPDERQIQRALKTWS